MTQPGPGQAVAPVDLDGLDAWWRAANYLSVGQIYLLDNPLLAESLRPEHVKPRLLGHWGTTPGLNFVYAHLNRAIVERDLDTMYICGPGHGAPVSQPQSSPRGRCSIRHRRDRGASAPYAPLLNVRPLSDERIRQARTPFHAARLTWFSSRVAPGRS